MRPRLFVFVQCSLAACLALTACAEPAPPKPSLEGWREGDPIPDVTLVDQDGRSLRLSSYDDEHVLLGFFFTRCAVPEACPLLTRRMRETQRLLGDDVQLLSVTLDPRHDTPDVLKAYAEREGADLASWTFATGEPGLVDDALPALFNVIALRNREGTLTHNVKAALLAPGRLPLREWSDDALVPDEVARAVRGEQ